MKTNWKRLINPDYLGAYSLDAGDGKYNDIIATIRNVVVENVTGPDGKKEDCAVAHFTERDIKPMILNVTNMKTLEKLFKSKYIEDWAGRKIQIGVEPVKAFGDVVDALRIKKFLPREAGTPKCTDCGEEIAATEKMTVAQIVAATQKRYGRPMCAGCWMKIVETEKKPAEAEKPEEAGQPAGTEGTINE
jgi:ribosomal protein L34E